MRTIRCGPCVPRSQHVAHDQIADPIPSTQRVVGRSPALVRIRTELGALLLAIERLDRAVDVQCHPRLLAQGFDHDLAQNVEEPLPPVSTPRPRPQRGMVPSLVIRNRKYSVRFNFSDGHR